MLRNVKQRRERLSALPSRLPERAPLDHERLPVAQDGRLRRRHLGRTVRALATERRPRQDGWVVGCAVRGLAALVEAAATEASKAAEHPAGGRTPTRTIDLDERRNNQLQGVLGFAIKSQQPQP